MEQVPPPGPSDNLNGVHQPSITQPQESHGAELAVGKSAQVNVVNGVTSDAVPQNTTISTPDSPPPKKVKPPSRASTLLSNISTSTPLRLKRASQITSSTVMPVVVTPPESTQPILSGPVPDPLDSKKDGTNGPVTKKGQRRYSDASPARPRAGSAIGSAFESIRRRMGLKHEDSHETPPIVEVKTQETLPQPQEVADEKQVEDVKKEADGDTPLTRRRSVRETLNNFKRLRNKPPAPDTFEFAANFLNPGSASITSPTSFEHDVTDNSLTESMQDRPVIRHSLSAPSGTHSSIPGGASNKVKKRRSLLDATSHHHHHPFHFHRHHHDKPKEEADDDLDLTSVDDVRVPNELLVGLPMIKVDSKESQKERRFRIDPDQGLLLWESKKHGMIRVEDIKELRPGSNSQFYIQQFKLPEDYEPRWLTISYVTDGKYKTLHVVAKDVESFHSFYKTLLRLRALRMAMIGSPSYPVTAPNPINGSVPANLQPHETSVDGIDPRPETVPVKARSGTLSLTHEQRQSLWERHYWKGADFSGDQQLDFKEVQRMARRLSIGLSNKELKELFNNADLRHKDSLNFEEFRILMKALRTRQEIKRLYNKLLDVEQTFNFTVFEKFMRNDQKDTRTSDELREVFSLYATPEEAKTAPSLSSRSRTGSRLSLLSTVSSVRVKLSSAYRLSTTSSMPASPILENPAEGENTESPDQQLLKPPDINRSRESSPPLSPVPSLSMTLDGFTTYLLSTDNSPFREHNTGISHDMTRPLSEYYISSSHNTYLVGHQLVGDSTIEGYIRTLLHSCRSVEIDIWDGEKEPVITHGGTLTSKIPLRAICEAISKNAFVTSPYPVIISAEVHCGVPQQEKIAEIMKECFGETLIYAPIQGEKRDAESGLLEYLPSPDQLQGRILLKTKNLFLVQRSQDGAASGTVVAETDAGTETGATSDTEGHASERRLSVDQRRPRGPSRSSSRAPFSSRQVTSPEAGAEGLPNSEQAPQVSNSESHKAIKMSAALAELLVYTIGVKCRGINKKVEYGVEHMFSLSEKSANKMLKQGSVYYVGNDDEDGVKSPESAKGGMLDLIKHAQNHLVRIYPKGLRFRSTNYEPHRYWAAGAQLVALNWQTFDLGYMINHAMFLRNGRSGYVLKPSVLRTKDKRERELVTKRTTYCLEIRIISAQQIPRPRDKEGREIVDRSTMDPYVQASVHVPDWPLGPSTIPLERTTSRNNGRRSGDYRRSSSVGRNGATLSPEPPTPSAAQTNETGYNFRSGSTPAKVVRDTTGVIKNNGFNPVWEEDLNLKFEVAGDMLDLVFLKLSVRDEDVDDDEHALALYCISLGSLNQGYRHLPLHDRQMSQYLFATLFVHINLYKVETP